MFLLLLRIVNSPFGRVLQAIRENPFRAEAIGYRTVLYRSLSNLLAAAFATLAGALYALWLRYNGPDTSLSFEIMLNILLMLVIGGMGTMYGAVIGASLFVFAQSYLQDGLHLIHETVVACWRCCSSLTAGCCGWASCSWCRCITFRRGSRTAQGTGETAISRRACRAGASVATVPGLRQMLLPAFAWPSTASRRALFHAAAHILHAALYVIHAPLQIVDPCGCWNPRCCSTATRCATVSPARSLAVRVAAQLVQVVALAVAAAAAVALLALQRRQFLRLFFQPAAQLLVLAPQFRQRIGLLADLAGQLADLHAGTHLTVATDDDHAR